MLEDEVRKVIEISSNKLLQSSSPSVRYWVLTDIVRKGREDLQVQRALDECERYPPRVRLVQGIQADGTWPISERQRRMDPADFHAPSYHIHMTQLKNLLRLLHFVTRLGDERIDPALERLLSWQTEEGYIAGPVVHPFPQPHYNGYALYILAGFMPETDPRVARIAEWLMSTQRRDGGWSMPYIQDVRYLPEYRRMRTEEFVRVMRRGEKPRMTPADMQDVPSCHWTTMLVLWGLAEKPELRNCRVVQRGTDLILNRFFQRNPHDNLYPHGRNWTTIRYPHNKCNGLAALDVLTKIGKGPDDPRMERPIRWLLSARYRDGFWTDSDRPHAEAGQWMTLVAIEVLDRFIHRF